MTPAKRVVAEIMSGGSELASEVLSELHQLLNAPTEWSYGEPPRDRTVIVRNEGQVRFEPYANDRVKKARGADGRWVSLVEDGSWKTINIPRSVTWRTST